MADDTETQRVGVRVRDKIVNARREASRIAAVLEDPAESGCQAVKPSGTAIIYERDGRVFHLVVYDMGKVP